MNDENNTNLFKIDVETNSMKKIFILMNNHIKSHETRIKELESLVNRFLLKKDFENSYNSLINRIAQTEDKMAQTVTKVNSVSSYVQGFESKVNQNVDNSLHEASINNRDKIKKVADGISQKTNQINRKIEHLVNKIAKLEEQRDIKQLVSDIEEIKRRIGNNEPNKQVDVKQVDAENVQKIDNFDSCIDASCLSKDITDDKSLLYQVNMQKKTILDIINELNQMKKRLNLPLTQIPDISALQSSMEKPQLNDKRTNLKRRINGNLATVQIETELSKLRNDFDKHQANAVKAINAIQYELQQIKSNDFKQSDGSQISEVNLLPQNSSQNNSQKDDNNNSSGEIGIIQSYDQKNKKYYSNGMRKSSLSGSSQNLDDQQNPQNNEIANSPLKSLDVIDIKNKLEKIEHDYTNAMCTLERKVERDYVERLFDKFRSMIHSINDRVKELANINQDSATREDIQILLNFIKTIPLEERSVAALRKGPTCLFCGRPKAHLVE